MKYIIFLTLAVLFWSGNFIFGRMVSSEIGPLELAFYRWFFVFLILLPYLLYRFKHIIKVFKKEYIIIIIFSILGVSFFNTFLYFGLQTTTATNALLINSSTPIMIIVLSALILKSTITKIQSLGIFLSTLGVVFLVLKGNLENIIALEFTSGDLWILLSSLSWALYTVLLKYKPKELNAFDFLSITVCIGFIALLIVYLSFGYSVDFAFMENQQVLNSLIYIVIFPSILSFYFWNSSIVQIGASKAGQFTHLMPIFGAILAYSLLGERLEVFHIFGILFIAIGIYLSIFLKKNKEI